MYTPASHRKVPFHFKYELQFFLANFYPPKGVEVSIDGRSVVEIFHKYYNQDVKHYPATYGFDCWVTLLKSRQMARHISIEGYSGEHTTRKGTVVIHGVRFTLAESKWMVACAQKLLTVYQKQARGARSRRTVEVAKEAFNYERLMQQMQSQAEVMSCSRHQAGRAGHFKNPQLLTGTGTCMYIPPPREPVYVNCTAPPSYAFSVTPLTPMASSEMAGMYVPIQDHGINKLHTPPPMQVDEDEFLDYIPHTPTDPPPAPNDPSVDAIPMNQISPIETPPDARPVRDPRIPPPQRNPATQVKQQTPPRPRMPQTRRYEARDYPRNSDRKSYGYDAGSNKSHTYKKYERGQRHGSDNYSARTPRRSSPSEYRMNQQPNFGSDMNRVQHGRHEYDDRMRYHHHQKEARNMRDEKAENYRRDSQEFREKRNERPYEQEPSRKRARDYF